MRTPDAPCPDLAPLRPAFSELADLLYGLVGDYSQTQAEIDALADTGDPATVTRLPVTRANHRAHATRWPGRLGAAGNAK